MDYRKTPVWAQGAPPHLSEGVEVNDALPSVSGQLQQLSWS